MCVYYFVVNNDTPGDKTESLYLEMAKIKVDIVH